MDLALQAGQQAMPGMAAALRMARVRALIPLGRLDDAAATLQRLQGAMSAPRVLACSYHTTGCSSVVKFTLCATTCRPHCSAGPSRHAHLLLHPKTTGCTGI